MHPDDLLQMLDLSGKEAARYPATELALTSSDSPTPPAPASPTAFALDAWALRRGSDLHAESDRLRQLGLNAAAAADLHAAAFEPDPQLLPVCADLVRHQFLTELLNTPAYHGLHATTTLHEAASALAAVAFAEQLAGLRQPPPEGQPAKDPELAALQAAGRAVAAAEQEVTELHEAAAAIGLGPGEPGQTTNAQAVAALFRRVRGNLSLRRICELAGRYRRLAQAKQRQKTAHGLDDVVGVEPGGDLARLLPHELAQLAVPELELATLRRLVERQCLCREHRGVEPVGKGPVVVVLDESGSMRGDKIHTGKALALALAWVAGRQRRWCALVAFAGTSEGRVLALPPGRWDEAALADWLTSFLGGGTTCEVPLVELPGRYWRELRCPRGKTDMICITDAQLVVPPAVRDTFLAWKAQEQARLISIVIESQPGDLAGVSDEIHLVPSLAVTEPAVARAVAL
jgi:uncharacterized protein with von Willebrand factor type A (vWA) domain